MATDISGNLSSEIDSAKTFASSANLRCGRNDFMVTAVRGELIEGKTTSEYGFIEMVPLTSEPSPQTEGDRVGWSFQNGAYVPGTGPLLDDGMNPNRVGEACALKANFSTNRKMAASKIKKFFLTAWNLIEGDLKPGEIGGAWEDASLQVSGYYVKGWKLNGQIVPQGTPGAESKWVNLQIAGGVALPVTKETPGAVWREANILAGFVIDCTTKNHKKRTPNERGAYVGQQSWTCVSAVGTGENTKEAMKERFAKYKPQESGFDAVDDDGADLLAANLAAQQAATQAATQVAAAGGVPAGQNGAANGQAAAPVAPQVPQVPQVPVAPPTPPQSDWPPQAPWVVGGSDPQNARGMAWLTPGWLWQPGMKAPISVADYQAGKRA